MGSCISNASPNFATQRAEAIADPRSWLRRQYAKTAVGQRVRELYNQGPGFSRQDCGPIKMIGLDGAGKTTTLRILATLLAPDAGRVCIDGIDALQDPRAVRQRLGYVAQEWRSTRFSLDESCSSFRATSSIFRNRSGMRVLTI